MENKDQDLKFKTNINCGGCVSKVKPVLDAAQGILSWNVDIDNQDKVLYVQTSGLTEKEIVDLIQQKGFKAEPFS